MMSVDFEDNRMDETVLNGEATEPQPYVKRMVTNTEELEEE
jgi:hypothetical protein